MSAPYDSVHQIGRQRVRVIGNFAEITLHGAVNLEEARGLTALYDSILAAHEHIVMVTDLSGTSSMEAAARRLSVDWGRRNIARIYSAIYGGSRPMRAIITLLLSAIRVFAGRNAVVGIFETAEEAHRFVAPYRIPAL